MRLQLIALLPALVLTGPAHAQEQEQEQEQKQEAWSGEAVSRYQLYLDDDETSVSTVVVDTRTQLSGGVTLDAHLLIDAVSSASVDVVSAATGRWSEARKEIGARAQRNLAGVDFSLGYVRSLENDWASHAVQIGVGRDFLQRNVRVEASYGLVLNAVGRASDPVFEERMRAHLAELGISQLVDQKTRVGATYGLQRVLGYQSSPYRYVLAAGGSRMPESHPDTRLRQSFSGYALRSLADWLSLRGSYRFYWDDWGLRSHTGELTLQIAVSKAWRAGWSARLYQQRDAEFYRKRYQASLRYMTTDRELARFWNVGSTVNLGTRVGPLLVDARFGLVHYEFKNFEALSSRLALITSIGASLPW